jgi:ATP-dependent DNA helicase RecG
LWAIARANFWIACTSFFFKHLFQSGKVVGFTREEHLEIPSEALREALINSLCHRQWEKFNQAISIAIFDDRLEISNPGILPPELPVELMKQSHNSYPYNPIIAEVLFQIKMLEKWGTGVKRIIDVCHENKVPEPEWTNEYGRITVTFKRDNILVTQQADKVSGKVSNKLQLLNDRQKAILAFCIIPRSRREIFEHIQLKMHSDNFNKYIKPLIDGGRLSLTQPDSPKSPTQKYVLTTNQEQIKQTSNDQVND